MPLPWLFSIVLPALLLASGSVSAAGEPWRVERDDHHELRELGRPHHHARGLEKSISVELGWRLHDQVIGLRKLFDLADDRDVAVRAVDVIYERPRRGTSILLVGDRRMLAHERASKRRHKVRLRPDERVHIDRHGASLRLRVDGVLTIRSITLHLEDSRRHRKRHGHIVERHSIPRHHTWPRPWWGRDGHEGHRQKARPHEAWRQEAWQQPYRGRRAYRAE